MTTVPLAVASDDLLMRLVRRETGAGTAAREMAERYERALELLDALTRSDDPFYEFRYGDRERTGLVTGGKYRGMRSLEIRALLGLK